MFAVIGATPTRSSNPRWTRAWKCGATVTLDDSANPDAWLRRAEKNLAHAAAPMGEGVETECYYAQQAAEMAVKAVYVAVGIPHPHSHDIGELLDGLKERGVSVPDAVNAADDLTMHAARSRYPGVTNATENDRVEAVRLARAALDWAKIESARQRGKVNE